MKKVSMKSTQRVCVDCVRSGLSVKPSCPDEIEYTLCRTHSIARGFGDKPIPEEKDLFEILNIDRKDL